MKPTPLKANVTQAHTQGRNKLTPEVDRLLSQVRGALEWPLRIGPLRLVTTSATPLPVWLSDEIPASSAWDVTAYIRSFEATVPAANCVRLVVDASFARGTGAPILVGQTTVVTRNGGSGAATFTLTAANQMQLNLASVGVLSQSWSVWLEIRGGDA